MAIKLRYTNVTNHSATLELVGDEFKDEICHADIYCLSESTGNHSFQFNFSRYDQITLENLQPYTRYFCNWILHQCLVSRQSFDPINFLTLDGIPSPPVNVEVTNIKSISAMINWNMPLQPRGQIQKYKIIMTSECENTLGNKTGCVGYIKPEVECQKYREIEVDNITELTLKISTGDRYTATISAATRANEFGPTSDPVRIISLGSKPHKPTLLRIKETVYQLVNRTVMIEFEYPCPFTGNTTFDTVWSCKNCSREREESLKHIQSRQVSKNYIEASGILVNVDYQVQVKAKVTNCDKSNLNNEVDIEDNCYELSNIGEMNIECNFMCNNGECINSEKLIKCNWLPECADESDEWNCICQGFQCENGYCVEKDQRCDGRINCNDMSDEMGCANCTQHEFKCKKSGKCIEQSEVCDKEFECFDGSDEQFCMYRNNTCQKDEFKCYSGKCIRGYKRCNRRRDCEQGEDEQSCGHFCGMAEFTCKDKSCIPMTNFCDGAVQCLDGSDEFTNCHCATIREFACSDGQCINPMKVCDGVPHCKDGFDEIDCEEEVFTQKTEIVPVKNTTLDATNLNTQGYLLEDGGYPDFPGHHNLAEFQFNNEFEDEDILDADNVSIEVVDEL
eukprot:TRINITY_DN13653_c0_g1_i1.p1 TRINITY_DN13653_c0_g1~~TRINITY_DN13653_c0_g1_i1.p1  ORF type:complete len:666 (+),score=83.37 TRINITY_DN13653_c0_g1_i1:140-1999(+)